MAATRRFMSLSVRPVGHKSTNLDIISPIVHRRQPVLCREIDDSLLMGFKKHGFNLH